MSCLTTKPLIRVARRGNRGHGWSDSNTKSHTYYAASLANVTRVSREVRDLLRRNTEKKLRPEVRASHRFYDDIIKFQDRLDMTEDDDETTLEALEAARDTVLEASEEFQKLPDANRFVRTAAVAKLSAIRGLETKDQIQKYLEDVDVVVNWRLGRAEHAQKVKDEGYTDRHGVEHSPAKIASKKERDDAGRADPMARRRSAKGQGLQDEDANNESSRARHERDVRRHRRNPKKCDAIDASHAARNALPPPTGAERHVDGYIVCSYVAQGQQQRPTWSHAEIVGRVADLRERNGVPQLDRSEFGTYVCEEDSGWRVKPPQADWKRLRVKGRELYCPKTRSCIFPDEDEAFTALELFLAPSTSNDERKKMLTVPPEALTCAYCNHAQFDRISTRVQHEKFHCKSRPGVPEPSSSSEEESEEESAEEVAAPPSPKRARFWA